MRAAIYARVSSAAQRERHTIENQLPVLREYVRSQGWTLAGEYIDDGRSAKAGKLEARDGFARLVRDAEAGLFDALVVVDVDRLTRTDDMTERAAILGPFQRANIQIVTPSGGALDLRTFLGELYVTMQALVAAEENRKRSARIKAGKQRAIAEGRKPAGPTPYGLAYDRAEGRWSIDMPRANVLREIHRRVQAGESCLAIADDLHARAIAPAGRGMWERHKVWKLATSRHAIGEWVADKRKRLVVPVPPIVTPDVFAATQQALIAHGKRGLVRTRHVYLLEGLAVCGQCGAPIAIRSATTQRRGRIASAKYVCRNRKLAHRGVVRCKAGVHDVTEVDARVWAAVGTAIQSEDLAQRIRARFAERDAEHRDWTRDAAGYRAHLERLVKAEAGALARFRRQTITEAALDLELAAIARERAAVTLQLATADRAAKAAGVAQVSADDVLAELRALVASSAPEARQRIVRAVVKPGAIFDGPCVLLTLRIEAPTTSTLGARGFRAPGNTMASVVGPGLSDEPRDTLWDDVELQVVA